MWDSPKAVLIGKFIAQNAYVKKKKEEWSQIYKLGFHITKMYTKRQLNPSWNLNIKTIENINETKSWFLQKINKNDKTLARFTKEQREKIQITNEFERADNTIQYGRH